MPTRPQFAQVLASVLLAVAASTVSSTALSQEATGFATPLTRPSLPSVTEEFDLSLPTVFPPIAEPETEAAPLPWLFSGPLHERSQLTGDWYGTRSTLAGPGVTFDVSTTQFYQGVARGGLEQAFQCGGRNDYFMNVDGEKSRLWKGAAFTLHGETRYGESANSLTGALAPVSLMLTLSLSTGSVSGLTGVKFTQILSEHMLVYAGKLNWLDDFLQPLTGAGPLTGFQNSAMIYNPVYARTIPYSTFGAGFADLKDRERIFEATVYDTNSTPTVSGFSTSVRGGSSGSCP